MNYASGSPPGRRRLIGQYTVSQRGVNPLADYACTQCGVIFQQKGMGRRREDALLLAGVLAGRHPTEGGDEQ
jgi:hypothetical protein